MPLNLSPNLDEKDERACRIWGQWLIGKNCIGRYTPEQLLNSIKTYVEIYSGTS